MKRDIGISFAIVGALMMVGSITLFKDAEFSRIIRFGGGALLFLGSILTPNDSVNERGEKEQ